MEKCLIHQHCTETGALARSLTMSLGNQEAPRSILASGTSFHEDLVIQLFLRPFFLFHCFKKSSCQLMANGCALSTGYLPRGGLPRNSMDRITDRPDMTSAVDHGCKASIQTNKQNTVPYFLAFCGFNLEKRDNLLYTTYYSNSNIV